MSTTDGVPPPTPTDEPVRASNDERAEVVEALQHALGEGRLDLAETEERVASAYSAQYRRELIPLLSDLPEDAAPSALLTRHAPSWPEVWRALVWRVRLLVLGDDAVAMPTARQCRTATRLVMIAVAWLVVCALVGALAVGA